MLGPRGKPLLGDPTARWGSCAIGNIWRASGGGTEHRRKKKSTHQQLKQNSRGQAGREASQRQATAFIAPPGTPPSLPGWESTNADPAPVWTLVGKGGEETLGAALAPPNRPAPALPRGLVWVRKSKMCPQSWTGTTWLRRIPRDKG